MKLFRTLFLGCAMLGLSACADYPQTDALLAAPEGLPRQAEVDNVRFLAHVDQQGAPAALAMALNWSGSRLDVGILAPHMTGDGLQTEILGQAKQYGRHAWPVNDLRSVLEEVAAGHPVLVRQEPSGRPTPVWRYALVVGYDLDAKVVYAHSGRLERVKVPIQVFESNWQRAENWGVVVMAPNSVPASSMALAAYQDNQKTIMMAKAEPATTQPARQQLATAQSRPDRQLAAKALAKTEIAAVPAPKPSIPTSTTTKVAGKQNGPAAKSALKKPAPSEQLATVPAGKPAATPARLAPTSQLASHRTAAMDPALARLLSVVPVAYQR